MSRLIFLESLSEPFCCSNLGHRQISPLFQRKHNAQISYASKERRRHIFRGVKSSMYQDKQICCHQVYEKQLQQYRPGDQLTGDSGIAEALSSSQCCQTSRSPLRPANRETRSGVRAYGHEHIRAHSRTTQLCGRRSDKKLHVSANERNGIFHRDIKPENILIMEEVLKLADFGSCRGVYSKQPYTEYISTRWYRAPECLLTDGYYNYKMDMWGVGCVFFEIVSLFPLFPGNNELDQIQKIHKILGTPPQQLLEKMKRRSQHADFKFSQQDGTGIARLVPHASASCVDLLTKLLAYNPDDRLSARQALRHIYFKDLREKDKLQQAFHNANRNHSVRPSPRVVPHENTKQRDIVKVSINERVPNNQSLSSSSSPQSMASVLQLPNMSSTSKSAKEDERDIFQEGDSTPLSNFADMHSPATYTSGSAVSNYVAPEVGPTQRDNSEEACMEFGHALPPIKSSYNNPTLSPKLLGQNNGSSNFKNNQRLQTPKAYCQKSTKSLKGAKSHRALPELSPKSTVGTYKPGEPPPYKKRANNSKSKELVDLQSGSREDSKQVRLRGGGEPQTSKNKGLEFPQCKNSTTYFSLGRSNQPDFKYQKTLIY